MPFAKEHLSKADIFPFRGGHIITRQMEETMKRLKGYWGYPITNGLVLAPIHRRGSRERGDVFKPFLCAKHRPIGQIIFVAMRDIDSGEALTRERRFPIDKCLSNLQPN